MKSSGIHPFTWQGSLWEAFSWCRSLLNSIPFEMHNSYCPALLGYKILLHSLQGCSSFQCHHHIACLLMRKPHLCFNTSSRTFSLVTLKFHCLGTWYFQLEFFLFDNYFIFLSVIHSVLQHAISVHVFLPCEISIISVAHWCWYCRYCCTFSFNRLTHDTE
jgi:hypothetical protein